LAHGIEYPRLANVASPELLLDHPAPIGCEVLRGALKRSPAVNAGEHDENRPEIHGPRHVTILLRVAAC
jgi:hypothetical protein